MNVIMKKLWCGRLDYESNNIFELIIVIISQCRVFAEHDIVSLNIVYIIQNGEKSSTITPKRIFDFKLLTHKHIYTVYIGAHISNFSCQDRCNSSFSWYKNS